MSIPDRSAKQQQAEQDSNSPPSQSPNSSKLSRSEPQSHQAEFQKNYPKNIFIPLIEYLGELGYKQAYEQCVGCKREFQGKNVVSLSSIHTLISQNWFERNISKTLALSHLSNKILINSKIKKKLFHLLIAHLILAEQFSELKEFKRRVSREANRIARKTFPNDQLFAYPNAIIYLLHLFLKVLLFHANKKGYNKLEDEFSKLSLEEATPATEKAKNGSKEEYKFYVKEIVHIFASKGITAQNYTDTLEQVKQSILEKDRVFREKYQLVEGIPNWTHFVECVVLRCFENKKKDVKITNFLFNDWITECKNKMLSIDKSTKAFPQTELKLESQKWINDQLGFHEKWAAMPLPLIESGPVDPGEKQPPEIGPAEGQNKAKKFTPIILSKLADK